MITHLNFNSCEMRDSKLSHSLPVLESWSRQWDSRKCKLTVKVRYCELVHTFTPFPFSHSGNISLELELGTRFPVSLFSGQNSQSASLQASTHPIFVTVFAIFVTPQPMKSGAMLRTQLWYSVWDAYNGELVFPTIIHMRGCDLYTLCLTEEGLPSLI